MSDEREDDHPYEQELTTDLDDDTPDKPKGMPLHTKIFIGLAVGVIGGLAVNWTLGGDNPWVVWSVEQFTRPIGQLFLNLLLMIVVPLVFSSLVVGVAGIGDIRKLGRIGFKSFAYTLIISAISVVIGLGLANTIRPGDRLSDATEAELKAEFSTAGTAATEAQRKAAEAAQSDTPLMQAVKTIVPSNVFNSISGASPNMLHIMFFALIIGIAITLLPETVSAPFVSFNEGLFAITAKIIDIVMKFAPYAVACLLFNNIAQFGTDLLLSLGWFVLTVLLGLSIHFFGVYSLSVKFLSRISPIEFFKRIQTVILTAFSTSSSNATLPTALRRCSPLPPRELNDGQAQQLVARDEPPGGSRSGGGRVGPFRQQSSCALLHAHTPGAARVDDGSGDKDERCQHEGGGGRGIGHFVDDLYFEDVVSRSQ